MARLARPLLVATFLLAASAPALAWVPAPFHPDVPAYLYDSVGALLQTWGAQGMATHDAISMTQIIQADSTNGTVLSTGGATQWYKQYLPCTMFLTDAAGWARSGVPLDYSTDIPQLSDLLAYSIYPGDITLFNKRNVAMTMSNGQIAHFRSSGTRANPVYTITDAMGNTVRVAPTGDRAGGCIVVQVKDVLMPNATFNFTKTGPTATLEMAQDSNVGVFYNYCLQTGVCNSTLNSTTEAYTVFAQIDASAALWGNGQGIPIGPLTNAVKEHVVPGRLLASDIYNGLQVTTLSGANITFYTNQSHITLFVGGHWAVVTKADIEAGLSIIHESDDDYDANYTSIFWTAPNPCVWADGSCGASNDYLFAIPDDEIYTEFGLKHKTFTMKQLQCNGKYTEEVCAETPLCVWTFAGQCSKNSYRDDASGACPNTIASQYFDCRINYMTEESCNADDKCGWNPILNNATGGPTGSPWTACFEKSLANGSVPQLVEFLGTVLYNMDPEVFNKTWGECWNSRYWYPAIKTLVDCSLYSSEDACHLEQCIWIGTACIPDFSRFLGYVLVGAGEMQDQAMQCTNPFRTTLGQQACEAYRLIPPFYA